MHVYVVCHVDHWGDARAAKVGLTNNVAARMDDLRVGASDPLELFGWVRFVDRASAADAERFVHHMFEKSNTSGEWFRADPAVLFAQVLARPGVVKSEVVRAIKAARTLDKMIAAPERIDVGREAFKSNCVYTEKEVAEITSLSTATLGRMRANGIGPACIYMSPRRLGYRRRDLEAWMTRSIGISPEDRTPSSYMRV